MERVAPANDAPADVVQADADSATLASIAEIWTGLLGVADIRGEDNFFDLGGHSLLAVQAHRDIKAALGSAKLTITDIFRFPTLSALAGHIDRANGPARAAPARVEKRPADQIQSNPAAPKLTAEAAELVAKRRAMRARRQSVVH